MGIRDLFFGITAKDDTGAAFAGVKSNLRDVDGLFASLDTRLTRSGASIAGWGGAFSLALAPITLAMGGGIRAAGDFEASVNRLGAVSRANAGDLAALKDQARDLGSTTKFTAGEAADGMSFLAMAGFEANDILSATPGVLQLAAAANMDLADSADIVSNVLTGYGLAAEEVGRANDVMVATMTRSNTDLRQLGDAFKYVGPVARAAGIEIEFTSALLGKLGDAGIQGEMGGTALRGALTRLLNPTREVQDALSSLGVSVTDASGALLPFDEVLRRLEPHADDAGAMMQLFGQRAGPAMIALLSQGTEGIFELRTALEQAGGTAETVANQQMQGLNGAMLSFSAAWEGLGIAIGESGVLDALTSMVGVATDFVRWVSQLDPMVLRFGTTIIGMGVAAGGAAIAVGGVTTAVGLLSTAIRLSPVGGFVSLASLAAGAFAALYPEIDTTTGATDTLTLAMGDEIRQSQGLTEALGINGTMSMQVARQKLSEAQARHENVKAIIAERRALALESDSYGSLLKDINAAEGALRSVSGVRLDEPARGREDQFDQVSATLAGLRRRQQEMLAAGEAEQEQLERTAANIADLEERIAGAEGGAIRLGDGIVDVIVPGERLAETVDRVSGSTGRLGGSARTASAETAGLGATLEDVGAQAVETAGLMDGFGRETSDALKDVFAEGRLSLESFSDFADQWGKRLLDRLLSSVFDPLGDAIQAAFDGGFGSGAGGGFGGLVSGAGKFVSGLLGFDTGGEMEVTGRAGIDRNVAAFRVSADENIKVVKRGQPDGGRPVNVYIQTPDPAAFKASKGRIAADIARAVGHGARFT
ncbi:MAG: phage tail tape measure protein [Pseudomonadota bacterium]